jgi:hypothetical protein
MRAVASGPPKSKLKGTTKDAEFMEVSKDHSSSKHNKDDEQDNDSTGSSPIGKRRNFSRRLPVTERKTRKSDNYLETLRASASVPAKSKLKGTAEDREFREIRKNLFCRPDEEDDSGLYLNYHPATTIGYEGFDAGFNIPPVSIDYLI